jgi:hypothetical protein
MVLPWIWTCKLEPLNLVCNLLIHCSLGNWFNCTASNERQAHIEKWIKERYPETWKELEALGHWVTMDGFGWRQYNINRDLEP